MHTRLVAAKFIPDKQPCRIVETVMEKWIGVGYGLMEGIHSDIGGEMSNKEMHDVASNLSVRLTTTSSYSPHQNGVNERNHGTVELMIRKMMESDNTLSAENALFWALNAKNALENTYGFSPYQLVFATNPNLPSVTRCGPPGYEGVSVSKAFVKNSNALHLAREEFVKAESSQVLKKALKSRIHPRGENISEGDYIYFKKGKDRIWRGPSKVIGVNGKKIFIDEGAHMSTVNRDDAVRVGEEFWSMDDLKDGESVPEPQEKSTNEIPVKSSENTEQVREPVVEEIIDNLNDTTDETATTTPFSYKDIKKGDLLKFVPGDSDELTSGRVVSRAGKAQGKYCTWWNIKNIDTGNSKSYDSGQFKTVEKIVDEVPETPIEQAFVVQIPRHLHNEPRCMEAKERELASWDEFGVYEEVPDEGQVTLGTSWLLRDKVIDGKPSVKARLCVRGDQEESSHRTDSPTVHKDYINIFYMLAAHNNWEIETADIKCAFLQGEDIGRDVYVRPPKERRVDGVIWKMKKPAYGLSDASRKFYLQLCSTLVELGCKQSKYDPAVYLYYNNEGVLDGLAMTHVDDLMHGSGGRDFQKNVMEPLKKKFKFGCGSEDKLEFRYVGMQVKQSNNCILVNQDHYLSYLLPVRKRTKNFLMKKDRKNTEIFSVQ